MQLIAINWRDLANPSAGGSEVVVDRLLSGFAERGHEVALVCGGPVGEQSYDVVKAGGTFSQYVLAPLLCMMRYRRADVIIDVENGLPYFSPLWRRRPLICLVHHVHTDQWHDRFPSPVATACRIIESRLMPLIYRNKVFVAISCSTAQALQEIGVDPARIHVIEPGIDYLSHVEWSKSEEPLFLSLCRLVPHKRVDLVLEAWRTACVEIPGRLVVAGDGPELANLRRLASNIPRVDVVGRVTDEEKWRLLGQSWAIVGASHHEGWGLTAMEAAVVGTPSLAVDAPGVRDAVVDGATGVLVPAQSDNVSDALAHAWVDLAENTEIREGLGAAARERSRTFGWDHIVDTWLKLISEVSDSQNENASMPARDGQSSKGAFGQSNPTKQERSHTGYEAQQALRTTGFRRSVKLFKGFRTQYDDRDGFYTFLAEDTVAIVERYEPVGGKTVVDVGGGTGYFAKAFRRAGATSCFVEPFWDALTESGEPLSYGVIGDGMRMPFPDETFDISHSSNVIEHVLQPKILFNEMLRVVRPGGLIFLAFTNWFSPFGGHETSPWHYLGGERAALRYERKFGYAPKNRFGESLFRLDIGEVLAWARSQSEAELIDAFPRYYPTWSKGIVSLPGVREVVTWNLVLVLRRH